MNHNQITVLVDNDSWILPYAQSFVYELISKGYEAKLARNADEVDSGWINFMLGCTRIVGNEVLNRNKHNLVVHESDLPSGRGFAPMTWQILEGKHAIPICLIEASDNVDAGDIWIKDQIQLDGTELCEEWRNLQGKKTVEMCMQFVLSHASLSPKIQSGTESFYKRRRPSDSQLDIEKNLKQQFNQLRVVDNERYPAYFEINGNRYILKIYKG